MGRDFQLHKDYYDTGFNLYRSNNVIINEGVTILVGCNGSGKTTLLNNIKQQLEKEDVPVIMFDNLREGGREAHSNAMFSGDIAFVATSLMSSEGENICMNLGKFAEKLGAFIRKNETSSEIWVLLDAIDSGLSIDNVVDSLGLFDFVIKRNREKDIYFVVSANEYELTRGRNCFDVYNGKYITFSDYEEYRGFILNSRKVKDARYPSDGEK